jgi:hypothetical protein
MRMTPCAWCTSPFFQLVGLHTVTTFNQLKCPCAWCTSPFSQLVYLHTVTTFNQLRKSAV